MKNLRVPILLYVGGSHTFAVKESARSFLGVGDFHSKTLSKPCFSHSKLNIIVTLLFRLQHHKIRVHRYSKRVDTQIRIVS